MSTIKDSFFAAKPRLREFKVEGMEGPVYFRPLSLDERGKFADSASKSKEASIEEKFSTMTLKLIIWATVDKEGKAVFEESDAEQLKKFDGEILINMQDVILEHSGLTVKAKEELEKNFETTPTESEPS